MDFATQWDPLSYVGKVKAIYTVSTGLHCKVDIQKVTRCSTPMATMSDSLSKGEFLRFWDQVKEEELDMPLDMAWVPQALLKWIQDPKEDDRLGQKILMELSQYIQVLGLEVWFYVLFIAVVICNNSLYDQSVFNQYYIEFL